MQKFEQRARMIATTQRLQVADLVLMYWKAYKCRRNERSSIIYILTEANINMQLYSNVLLALKQRKGRGRHFILKGTCSQNTLTSPRPLSVPKHFGHSLIALSILRIKNLAAQKTYETAPFLIGDWALLQKIKQQIGNIDYSQRNLTILWTRKKNQIKVE